MEFRTTLEGEGTASEGGELDRHRRADIEMLERLGERAGRVVDAENREPVGVLVGDHEGFSRGRKAEVARGVTAARHARRLGQPAVLADAEHENFVAEPERYEEVAAVWREIDQHDEITRLSYGGPK